MIVSMNSPELREQLVRTVITVRHIDRVDAEDAVQDAYICALCTKNSWAGRSTVRTWLTRVALNASKMRGRKKLRIEKYETVLEEADFVVSEFSPYDHACGVEKFELFKDMLPKLSAINRQAILMVSVDPEVSYKVVAEQLRIPINTFKARVHRARVDLQAAL